MKEDIAFIQNYIWKMYKDFEKDYCIQNYENNARALCKKYRDNQLLLNYCQNLIISWTPVINNIKHEAGDK